MLILYLNLLDVFQSGYDQIDYNDPEVIRAWEKVYYGIDQFNIINETKIDSTFAEKDSLSIEPLENKAFKILLDQVTTWTADRLTEIHSQHHLLLRETPQSPLIREEITYT